MGELPSRWTPPGSKADPRRYSQGRFSGPDDHLPTIVADQQFFRWISERYPLTSQLITPNSIPTFDNLYLDMNGIIHNCSHPPSSEGDIHFRISEEQMILAIFAYIDHLFTKIKPQKVFFMAIDGVAPRAKMNQQRSRRFRTARDAREKRQEAERKGEKLPEEKAFDSNCITPGTPFMARLSNHLKYYVSKRISEDAEWRNVKVILSGHDVPGEGEHKIQEFIRLTKAQPEYNPNTRHCLYGLDADLIMLGLLSHDPHFCLLREEVTFGRKVKKSTGLANANFYLLHISLLREYLNLEFSSIAEQIPFEYDLERIIDDFILMGIFVGNDFLPHLPDLHINEGALERIWTIYKSILPTAGGYLNEHGTISLPRLQLMLDRLADYEKERFEEEFADQNWYKGKQTKDIEAMEKARKRGKLIITKDQKKLFEDVKAFVLKHQSKPSHKDRLALVNKLSARERRFLQELADSLHLRATWDEVDDYGQPLIVLSFDMEGVSEDGTASEQEDQEGEEAEAEDGEWESETGEGEVALNRVFGKYEKAKVVENTVDDFEETYEETMKQKMDEWKRGYYKDKLELNPNDESQLHTLVFRYVEGLQWVLNYYYKGCSSWGWFYDYHFAPRITDLLDIANMKFDFDLGKPFTPFQQLMGVLPEDSKEHVPAAYRDLMTEETSPIFDFYPRDFELDMNGKKQDWEAVVKIPFIDQARLLRAMAPRDVRLTEEEKQRNKSGVLSTQFTFDESRDELYPSSQPGFFPDLAHSHALARPFNLPTLGDGVDLILGLLDGAHLGDKALAGFPSLHTIPHQGALGYHGVSVFQSDSRNQSMIITVTSTKGERGATDKIAEQVIGRRTFITWPYLHEGMVVGVSDDMFKYEKIQFGRSSKVVANPHNPFAAIGWKKQADQIEHHHSKRFGVITGHVDRVLHVRPLKGLKRLDTGALVKDYEGPEKEVTIAYQMAVSDVAFEDERYLEQAAPPVSEEFPDGERVICLGQMAYGTAAQVMSTSNDTLSISLAFFPSEAKENRVFTEIVATRPSGHYYPAHVLGRRLGLSGLQLSKICSTLMVRLDNDSKVNIGIPMKFESKGLKVLGYTRRADRGWEYSELAARALERYKAAFPEAFNNLGAGGEGLVTSAELCPTAEDPDKVIKDMKKWLVQEGLADLEPVSLFAEKLEQETVSKIEGLADRFASTKTMDSIKRAAVQGIPRQAVLKPSHAAHRLVGQEFKLGDRVVMVQDSAAGGVPLALKGVVVGISSKDIDVVWDRPFMGGETLGGRCSEYRGSVVPFTSCLNLTRPQYAADPQAHANGNGNSNAAAAVQGQRGHFQPQLGPRPNVAPRNYQPSIPSNKPVSLLRNPHGKPPSAAVNGNVPYGQAAKGLRPQHPHSHPTATGHQPGTHHKKLQSALLGGKAPAQHVAHRPGPISPKSPSRSNHPLPNVGVVNGGGHVNGAAVSDATRGGRGARGGRGRGAPRGRGRGGGGSSAQVN